MRVQFISYDNPGNVSGVNSWLQKLLPPLRALGIDARLDLFCRDPGPNVEWFSSHGVPIRMARARGDVRMQVVQCLRWLAEDMPAVYVPSCILPAYFAAAEARRCGARTIGVLHSDELFYWGLVDQFVAGPGQWRLNDMVVVSNFLKQEVDRFAPPGVAVHNIPYGITIPADVAEPPDRRFRIVYTGRLVDEQKRISDVARAFCHAARRHPELEAWIVGGGSREAGVRKIIEEERMQDRVLLKGSVKASEIHGVLRQCHAHVLLSDYEGLPVSMLEAMAAGVVPVCLDIRSGIRDVLRHMENSMIVTDRGDSFLNAVSHLLRDRAAWRRMSLAARRTAEDYSTANCVERWRQLLMSDTVPRPAAGTPAPKLVLPPRNPKFGARDHRFSPIERVWFYFRKVARSVWHGILKLPGRLSGRARLPDTISNRPH